MLSERIYTLRRKSGFSQEQLAERIGVSRQAISKWETGTATPELEKLVALSECFGITLDELIRDAAPAENLKETPPPAEPQKSAGGRHVKIGALLCLAGAVGLLLTGILLIAHPTAADRLNEASAVTLRGSGLLLMLCVAVMAAGLILILRRR